MRLLDEEKRLAEREASAMCVEALFGRQLRFREADKANEDLHNEWRERKSMQAERNMTAARVDTMRSRTGSAAAGGIEAATSPSTKVKVTART
jgi:hypothetical protein